MKKCTLNKKLKSLDKTIKTLLVDGDDSINKVHNLRKKTRELLSLVSSSDPFYSKLKKIIKISNHIRDIDVFLSTYLTSLKSTYKQQLNLNKIMQISKNSRNKFFNQLYIYLEKLYIPHSVKCKNMTQYVSSPINFDNDSLLFEQKVLHKYRIYIKNELYRTKNQTIKNKRRIELLTKIKDLLGNINDNYNGLARLKKFNIKTKLFEEIEEQTIKKNIKYFDKVKKLNTQL